MFYPVKDGKVILGTGDENSPFIVGATSTGLLKTISKAISAYSEHRLPIVFHFDGTFKLNVTEFPLVVIGLTDGGQHFHPLAFFTVSHRTTNTYVTLIRAFKAHLIDAGIVGDHFYPHFIMADAEVAEHNAFKSEFPQSKYLMCYFHVKQNVISRFTGTAEELEGKHCHYLKY